MNKFIYPAGVAILAISASAIEYLAPLTPAVALCAVGSYVFGIFRGKQMRQEGTVERAEVADFWLNVDATGKPDGRLS